LRGEHTIAGGRISSGVVNAGGIDPDLERGYDWKLDSIAVTKLMRKLDTNRRGLRRRDGQRGFTLMEMLMATVIILVGLVAVAQLVPVSVMMNSNNRNDGTALVFAQRVFEGMRNQPLSANSYTDPQGVVCPLGNTCSLGDPTQPWPTPVGSPLNTTGTSPIIDFSAGQVAGYSFNYVDPNDPLGATYDVRWAVVTKVNNGIVTNKRIILGVFRRGMKTITLPVTLDTMVSK
jgi:prepilin-type N-terminal cleavage/methylation domain-containing protein